ncbi:MAG: tannase/feruloyl esterase family alpha/beta hydrolase, partial [Acidobacteriota bacterium]|nr:tannase/feruloyl esterase family alpha/beta hydrolase [Acidobacteriota bacterium]
MNPFRQISTLALLLAPTLAHAATCESLTTLAIPNVTITSALDIPAGGLSGARIPANLPAFCRVAATLRPSSDSDIKMELWLPAPVTWNGKYEANGNGGWSGS